MAYVYLISEEPHPGEVSGPWTKIGYTKNPPEWRLDANLTRGNSRVLSVLTAFKYPTEADAQAAEHRSRRLGEGDKLLAVNHRPARPPTPSWRGRENSESDYTSLGAARPREPSVRADLCFSSLL